MQLHGLHYDIQGEGEKLVSCLCNREELLSVFCLSSSGDGRAVLLWVCLGLFFVGDY